MGLPSFWGRAGWILFPCCLFSCVVHTICWGLRLDVQGGMVVGLTWSPKTVPHFTSRSLGSFGGLEILDTDHFRGNCNHLFIFSASFTFESLFKSKKICSINSSISSSGSGSCRTASSDSEEQKLALAFLTHTRLHWKQKKKIGTLVQFISSRQGVGQKGALVFN